MNSPIFMHLRSARLPKAEVKRMEAAGYVVLCVNSFDDVRIVDPIPAATVGVIAKAAFESIAAIAADKSTFGTQPAFGSGVAAALSKL